MAPRKDSTTNAKETAVREAAHLLGDAVREARAAGFTVSWPSRVEDLDSIEISATGAVPAEGEEPVEALQPVPGGATVVKASDA